MGKAPEADVLVVGAGVFGLACAWACARRGMRVVVAEAQALGAGASGGVVGALAPFAPAPWGPRKAFQLAALRAAEAGWAEVAAAGGVDPGYARVGRLTPLGDAAARARAEAQAQAAAEAWGGAAAMRVLDARRCAGGLGRSGRGGAWGAVGRPDRARRAATCAGGAGGGGPGARAARSAAAGAPRRSEMAAQPFAQGRVAAGVVIVATGASGALTPGLPLRAVKGQAAVLEAAAPPGAPLIGGEGLWIVPHGAGRVAVGSTVERAWRHAGPDDRLDAVLARAAAICPALRGAAVVERWAGLRPRAGRPDPMLGPVPGLGRVLVATGGLGIGFGLALAVGEAMAEMAAGGAPALPEAYSVAAHLPER